MRRLCVVALLTLLSLANLDNAFACLCSDGANWTKPGEARRFLDKEFRDAVIVFSGKVVTRDMFKVTIKAEKFWKGDIKEEVILSTGAKKIPRKDRNDEDMVSISTCDYKFEAGKKYLVFAKSIDGELITRRCSGTDLLSNSGKTVTYLNEMK
ncbi:MAG TPA: hypothetical protein VFV58_31650 [Blastocatellia bacterium]|jgi:hypothetical protein|nr:hypothetical protein [Blastocatellia bacterium]